jgi:putative transposase
MQLRELAASRPRYGYRRLSILLRRQGWHVNDKRIYRLYCEEGLQVRIKRRKKLASGTRVKPTCARRVNERWTMDFVSDALADGRRIRVLTVIDSFTRECLTMKVAQSLPAR